MKKALEELFRNSGKRYYDSGYFGPLSGFTVICLWEVSKMADLHKNTQPTLFADWMRAICVWRN